MSRDEEASFAAQSKSDSTVKRTVMTDHYHGRAQGPVFQEVSPGRVSPLKTYQVGQSSLGTCSPLSVIHDPPSTRLLFQKTSPGSQLVDSPSPEGVS